MKSSYSSLTAVVAYIMVLSLSACGEDIQLRTEAEKKIENAKDTKPKPQLETQSNSEPEHLDQPGENAPPVINISKPILSFTELSSTEREFDTHENLRRELKNFVQASFSSQREAMLEAERIANLIPMSSPDEFRSYMQTIQDYFSFRGPRDIQAIERASLLERQILNRISEINAKIVRTRDYWKWGGLATGAGLGVVAAALGAQHPKTFRYFRIQSFRPNSTNGASISQWSGFGANALVFGLAGAGLGLGFGAFVGSLYQDYDIYELVETEDFLEQIQNDRNLQRDIQNFLNFMTADLSTTELENQAEQIAESLVEAPTYLFYRWRALRKVYAERFEEAAEENPELLKRVLVLENSLVKKLNQYHEELYARNSRAQAIGALLGAVVGGTSVVLISKFRYQMTDSRLLVSSLLGISSGAALGWIIAELVQEDPLYKKLDREPSEALRIDSVLDD